MMSEHPGGQKAPDGGVAQSGERPFTFTREIADFRGTVPQIGHFHFHSRLKAVCFLPPGRRLKSMPPTVVINLYDETDRWRWVCPNGHRSWEPVNGHFWCSECANAWSQSDTDPEFRELRDKKTGETVPRERIQLEMTPTRAQGGSA